MITRTGCLIIFFITLSSSLSFSQDNIIEVIDLAKDSYTQESYYDASKQLIKALQLINEKILSEIKASFPKPLNGWRALEAKSLKKEISSVSGLKVKRNYFKKGGGSSVDIEIVTNSMKIANIKMLFSSPSMLKRADSNLKINTIADFKCLEKYDPIDKYAELIFVPNSSLLITIIGQDMKDTKTIIKYAEKIDWEGLEEIFQ